MLSICLDLQRDSVGVKPVAERLQLKESWLSSGQTNPRTAVTQHFRHHRIDTHLATDAKIRVTEGTGQTAACDTDKNSRLPRSRPLALQRVKYLDYREQAATEHFDRLFCRLARVRRLPLVHL